MKGKVRLELTDATGARLAVRRAGNSVLRSGGRLVAELFSGQGSPISHMAVGTNGDPEGEQFATTSLTNEGKQALAGPTEVAIAANSFEIAGDADRRVVAVRQRATLPAGSAVGTVREAGLQAGVAAQGGVLYNRVTFEPIDKGDDHELTLFWEVSFPYGDLQWLT